MAGVLLAGTLAALVLGGDAAAAADLRRLGSGDAVQTLFQALVAGIITGVTLVLSVNQLVLSQELGALADQRERLRGAMDYREDAESYTGGDASPAEPAAFLRSLLESIGDRGRALAGDHGVAGDDPAPARYGADVAERAAAVSESLRVRKFGDFGMLWAALHFDYSRGIQEGMRLLRAPGTELAEDVRDGLDEVVRGLVLFGTVREHFKTLYFQRDLIDLSRAMLAAALPALVVAALTLLFYESAALPGRLLGTDLSVWVLSVSLVISVAPFALLLSFILRIATVARRTLAAGPFVLHPDQETGESLSGA